MIHVYFKDNKLPKEWHRKGTSSNGPLHLGVRATFEYKLQGEGYLKILCHPIIISIKYPGLLEFLKTKSVCLINTYEQEFSSQYAKNGWMKAYVTLDGDKKIFAGYSVVQFEIKPSIMSTSVRCETIDPEIELISPVDMFYRIWFSILREDRSLPDAKSIVKWEKSE